jgi:hypothetical protein
MNSPLVHESSAALATLASRFQSPRESAGFLVETIFCRDASSSEIDRAIAFVNSYAEEEGAPAGESRAWAAFARALFATNEFLYFE